MQTHLFRLAVALGVLMLLSGCGQMQSDEHEDYTAPFVERTKEFLHQHPGQYNEEVVFVADLERPRSSERFSVISLATGQILEASQVLNGKQDGKGQVIYSNVPESHTSSRGFAKVSERYFGQFGKAFKLDGLEETNSNMRRRAIVLHSYKWVNPAVTFNSQGCPTINPRFLEVLEEKYIKPSHKPVLLLTP